MSANAELLWILVEQLVLTALPGTMAVVFAMRRGLRSVPLLLCVALAGSGCTAMLTFWAYYADPTLGQTIAFFFVLGSLLAIIWCWREGLDRDILRRLAIPAILWALASAFVVYLGFLHGGISHPLPTSGSRFSGPLPYDNVIPRFFANWFYRHGHSGTPPLIGDWLASDRPPLQIGYVLVQRPFGWDRAGLHYEVLGVVLQQLWIVGAWALLCASRIRPLARGLAIFAALVSDIALVHGFFVWPKLIAAAFLLGALAMVVSADWSRLRATPWAAALFAALCGLALLAHGSSAFFIIPLLAVGAWRSLPSRSWLVVAVLVAVALLAPWSAYQTWGDPPGNRLVKWQIGGSLEIDDRSSLEAIVDGYREAGPDGTLENKWRNFTEMLGTGEDGRVPQDAIDSLGQGDVRSFVGLLRTWRFYSLFPFLGILLIAPIAMLFARARGTPSGTEWRFSLFALSFLCSSVSSGGC